MSWLPEFVTQNPPQQWLQALAAFAVVLVVIWLLLRFLRGRIARMAEATQTTIDDVVAASLARTGWYFPTAIAAIAASQLLLLTPTASGVLRRAVLVVVVYQFGRWATAGLTHWLELLREEKAGEGEVLTWLSGIGWVGKLLIWSVVLLLVLANLDVDVTGLVAGLGIGGIAVALAVQNILGDLFSSFSIYLDKPFVLGDVLAVDSLTGTVEEIGLKTTRLRSVSGEQLVFANGDLLKSRIRNYGKLEHRRVLFQLGVTYDTPPAKLRLLPDWVRESVEARENTRFDRCHFKEFGDSSLIIEVVYWVLVADYSVHVAIQQQVNLAILERFAAEKVEFAFPTRTVLLDNGLAPDRDASGQG